MDQIRIENLRIYAHHGVYAEENEKGQNFYMNAVLDVIQEKQVLWMIWIYPQTMVKYACFFSVS